MVVGAFRERPREGGFINVLLNLSGVFSRRSSVRLENIANFAKDKQPRKSTHHISDEFRNHDN